MQHKLLVFLVVINLGHNLVAQDDQLGRAHTITSTNQELIIKFRPVEYAILAYAAGSINFQELVSKVFGKTNKL